MTQEEREILTIPIILVAVGLLALGAFVLTLVARSLQWVAGIARTKAWRAVR